MAQTIAIERVDHIGIRVRDLDRALAFYSVLGFTLAAKSLRTIGSPTGAAVDRSSEAFSATRIIDSLAELACRHCATLRLYRKQQGTRCANALGSTLL